MIELDSNRDALSRLSQSAPTSTFIACGTMKLWDDWAGLSADVLKYQSCTIEA